MSHIPLHDRPADIDGTEQLAREAEARAAYAASQHAKAQDLERAMNQVGQIAAERDAAAQEQRIRTQTLALAADIAKAVGMAAGDVAELLKVLDDYTRNGPSALPKARPRKIAP